MHGTSSVPITYPYITYAALPEASRKLDGEPYPLLQQVVTGSKATLLTHVPRPSYVVSMLVLYKHVQWPKCRSTVLQERTAQFCPQLYLHKEKELKGEKAISEEGVF